MMRLLLNNLSRYKHQSRSNQKPHPIKIAIIFTVLWALFLLTGTQPAYSAPPVQGSSQAQLFETGDIIVSINNGDLLWYNSDGSFIKRIYTGKPNSLRGIAFNSTNQYLYVTEGASVRLYDSSANWVSNFGSSYEEPTSILFSHSGDTYVGQIIYSFRPLLRFNLEGSLSQSYSLESGNFGIMDMVLGSHQCTLYYTAWADEGRSIKRYDVCKDAPISFDLTQGLNLSEAAVGLQLLPDGTILVTNTSDIRRLNATSGSLMQSYEDSSEYSWFAVSLAPDGKSFWATSGTRVYKFDVASGNQLDYFDAGADTIFSQSNSISGITVIGEFRASPVTPTFTPTNTATQTITKTPTTTITYTPIPPTVSRTVIPTYTETPTSPPIVITPTPKVDDPSFPWGPAIISTVAVGGGSYLLFRKLRSKPRTQRKPRYRQPRVTVRVHENMKTRVLASRPKKRPPNIRFRTGRGRTTISVETKDPDES